MRQADKAVDIDGEWINQNGSTVVLETHADGTLTGRYHSKKGRAAAGRGYPLTGTVNGELVAFHVNWSDAAGDLHAITSFSGRLARGPDGRDCLHTLWILARQFEDPEFGRPTQPWNTFLTNADLFHRVA